MRLAISNVNCTALTEQKCKHVHGFVVLARSNLSTLYLPTLPHVWSCAGIGWIWLGNVHSSLYSHMS